MTTKTTKKTTQKATKMNEQEKTPLTGQQKLSIAVGVLSFVAFIVQGLAKTWGFEAVGNQIVETFLLFSGGVNIYFSGSTIQKKIDKNKEQDNGES